MFIEILLGAFVAYFVQKLEKIERKIEELEDSLDRILLSLPKRKSDSIMALDNEFDGDVD